MKRTVILLLLALLIFVVMASCKNDNTYEHEVASTQATIIPADGTTEALTEVTNAPTEKPIQVKKEETWKLLYKERINTYMSEVNDKYEAVFSLVHIDDNGIPELVMGGESHIVPATLCWVYDDALCENQMGYMISGGFTYVERSGLIDICSQWQGSGGDTIYELMQGRLIEIASGTFDKNNHNYTWQGVSVPAMDYDYMLCDVFQRADAKDVAETVYNYDRILSIIDSY